MPEVPTPPHGSLRLVGRSSSHFTRLVRIVAHELGLELELAPVLDLWSRDARTFGDNPTLRVPSLHTTEGTWFGSLNVCRELARRAPRPYRMIFPEALTEPLAANAFELTTDAMGASVTVVMARLAGIANDNVFLQKSLARIEGTVTWLDERLADVLRSLPPRDLSLLEVALFCFGEHLEFREILSLEKRPRLSAFCRDFARRPSALATPYAFDRRPS
jgi:glutathione S-transferase